MATRQPRGRGEQPPGKRSALVTIVEEAVEAFRRDAPGEYRELVEAFEGRSADVALFGHGRVGLAVSKGTVRVGQATGTVETRGAAAPETIASILDGQSTPLDEFFRGNLIVQAPSGQLHEIYGFFVKFADAGLRSTRMQKVIGRFKDEFVPAED